MPVDQGLLDRLPPHNLEAERCVLGAMLRDNRTIDEVVHIVRKEDFYTDAHQKIFETIVALNDQGGQASPVSRKKSMTTPVDTLILYHALEQREWLADVGGAGYLAELWDGVPSAANVEYYARIVREKALLRNLIFTSNEILGEAYKQTMPVDDLMGTAQRMIFELAEKGLTSHLVTLHEAIKDTWDQIDKRTSKGDIGIAGLSTGFADLNDLTAGLHDRELVIVAARPSVGKTAFSLGLVRNVITSEEKPAVFFVSLEQSRVEIAERLLCSQARVDSQRLRKGTLSSEDIVKLSEAAGVLRNAPLFIDDTPSQGMLRIAANARRLKRANDIRLVVIDYLQLIEPENRRDPRQEQVAQISRRLKFLARELEVPVVALAQVNRAAEDRQDHRPRLSDLRESGCLAGDTLVTLAEFGRRTPIRELAGKAGFTVWALDELTMKLKPAEVSNAFCTGRKPVFRLRTRLGRTVRATANHRFRAFDGWRRLDEFVVGQRLALPRRMPGPVSGAMTASRAALLGHLIGDGCTLPRHSIQYTTRERDLADRVVSLALDVFGDALNPRIAQERRWYQVYLSAAGRLTHGKRNPVASWLDELGAFGLRAWEKRVPPAVFEQPQAVVASFLQALWATDGCVRPKSPTIVYPAIYFASSSERLSEGVQGLLLRLGINARLRSQSQGGKGRQQHQVWVSGREDVTRFVQAVGAAGAYRSAALAEIGAWAAEQEGNTNRDVIPSEFWRATVVPAMRERGITMRQFQQSLGNAFCGTTLYKQNVSRERLGRVCAALGGHETLEALADSDVYWDQIAAIEPDGEDEVFDLTVPGPANFVANDVVVHNSIEQDADTVLMLHRPDRYEPGQHEGVIEVIVAKNRNGPVGEITLAYVKQYLRFEDYKVGTPFDG
jgi:replicative DNA helicase